MESTTLLLSISSAASTLTFVVIDVVFLVLVATTVRRQRPDAWGYLAAALGTAIGSTLLGFVSGLVGSMVVSASGGMEGFMRFTIASHLLLAMIGIVARILFIVGVLRLARDPSVSLLPPM